MNEEQIKCKRCECDHPESFFILKSGNQSKLCIRCRCKHTNWVNKNDCCPNCGITLGLFVQAYEHEKKKCLDKFLKRSSLPTDLIKSTLEHLTHNELNSHKL